MEVITSGAADATVRLSNTEVLLICNALNEIRHVRALDPIDMHARIGVTTEEVAATHLAMMRVLDAMDRF